jgi:hypothetical protein
MSGWRECVRIRAGQKKESDTGAEAIFYTSVLLNPFLIKQEHGSHLDRPLLSL